MSLKVITDLAAQQVTIEDQIATLEEQLKEAKERLKDVAERMLPEAMESEGITELKLDNGRVVKIETGWYAKIPEALRAEAFAWLRKNKLDGIIKRTLSFSFGRGDDKLASEVLRRILKAYPELDYADKEDVHHQTLGAFVRELMEKGVDIPFEPFGIYVKKAAKIAIEVPKKGKPRKVGAAS